MPRGYTNGLRKLRQTIDCSQREFAAILGVCNVNLNNWERSKYYPNARWRRLMMTRLQVTGPELAHMLDTPADDYTPPAKLAQRATKLLEQIH